MDPARLGARAAAQLIANGELTALALTEACLARIEARESRVHAWAHIEPDAALAQARACDAHGTTGPLHGVPVGVKDIIDTADLPTEHGSPIYAGHRPGCDAACVARIRAAGGVILGKTVTTEFAFRHPFGLTANPHDPAHTPGGSSSGSAAAVADFMVPLALGTQTGGSIIRPASFCGVYAYKLSYRTFPFDGVKPLAPGLDTLGPFARSVEDLAWVRRRPVHRLRVAGGGAGCTTRHPCCPNARLGERRGRDGAGRRYHCCTPLGGRGPRE